MVMNEVYFYNLNAGCCRQCIPGFSWLVLVILILQIRQVEAKKQPHQGGDHPGLYPH